MIKGVENNFYRGRLSFVCIFSLEMENLQCDLIVVFKNMRVFMNKAYIRYFYVYIRGMGLNKIRKMFWKWLLKEVLRFVFFRRQCLLCNVGIILLKKKFIK